VRPLAALALMAVPNAAWACSVCYSANEGNRWAFFTTTVFLSLLPLAMVGGIVYWLWREMAARAAE
jgi:hypothetical protein